MVSDVQVSLIENVKVCCCSLTVRNSSLKCPFINNKCEYFVSNTSTSFEFFYVFSIGSLGKLIQITLERVNIAVTITDGDNYTREILSQSDSILTPPDRYVGRPQ